MTREEYRKECINIVMQMLDDQDEDGIYQTSRCYESLAALYDKILPPAEGAEAILHRHIDKQSMDELSVNVWPDMLEAMTEFATLHAQRIAEKMVEEKSPSNEQIHAAALAWAKDHSEAPDKDCPDWLIRDYEAGAYFVRQCYGCLNKTNNPKTRDSHD